MNIFHLLSFVVLYFVKIYYIVRFKYCVYG